MADELYNLPLLALVLLIFVFYRLLTGRRRDRSPAQPTGGDSRTANRETTH